MKHRHDRRYLFAVLAVALLCAGLVGCSSPNKQILGTWEFVELDMDQTSNDAITRALLSTMTAPMQGTTMTFNDDATFSGQATMVETEGTYELDGRDVRIQYGGTVNARFNGRLSDDGKSLYFVIPELGDARAVYTKRAQ